MSVFILFVSDGVLFESAFSQSVSLSKAIYHSNFTLLWVNGLESTVSFLMFRRQWGLSRNILNKNIFITCWLEIFMMSQFRCENQNSFKAVYTITLMTLGKSR